MWTCANNKGRESNNNNNEERNGKERRKTANEQPDYFVKIWGVALAFLSSEKNEKLKKTEIHCSIGNIPNNFTSLYTCILDFQESIHITRTIITNIPLIKIESFVLFFSFSAPFTLLFPFLYTYCCILTPQLFMNSSLVFFSLAASNVNREKKGI